MGVLSVVKTVLRQSLCQFFKPELWKAEMFFSYRGGLDEKVLKLQPLKANFTERKTDPLRRS